MDAIVRRGLPPAVGGLAIAAVLLAVALPNAVLVALVAVLVAVGARLVVQRDPADRAEP